MAPKIREEYKKYTDRYIFYTEDAAIIHTTHEEKDSWQTESIRKALCYDAPETISKIGFNEISSILPLCKAAFAAHTEGSLGKKANAAEWSKT